MTISEELGKIVGYARDEAMRTGNMVATEAHLFLAVMRHSENSAMEAVRNAGADLKRLREEIEGPVFRPRSIPYGELDGISFSRNAGNALSMAVLEAEKAGAEAEAIHLLYAICTVPGSSVKSVLAGYGITSDYIKGLLPEGCGDIQQEVRAEVEKAAQDAFARAVAVSGATLLGAGSGKGVVS